MKKKKSNQDKIDWLEEQIVRRIAVAQEKLAGKHEGVNVPTSLRQNRTWENEELGIEQIGSAGSFTTTHKTHGKAVKKLNDELIKLSQPAKKKYKPLSETVVELTIKNEALNDKLTKTANQFVAWQTEVDELRDMFQIAESSEQGLIESKRELQKELDEKDQIIKNLRLELIAERNKRNDSSHDSKITKVDFGGDKS
ncbi:MAG: hypothetical protein ISR69_03155 [Gammaproteobacteria bacterium]|nr:hypothetical protein [Gammaproteobacteria bacterium]